MAERAVHDSQHDQPEGRQQIVELFARSAPAVQKYFARRVPNRAEAEDLTQEVFSRLLRRAEFGSIVNIEGYVFQIAANLLAERLRQDARRRVLKDHAFDQDWVDVGDEFSPERILLGKEAYRRVIEALQELPERVRVVFILNRFEELSGSEIARRLGVSVSTVEKHMMRAVSHLKERLR